MLEIHRRATPRRAASPTAQMVRVFNDRGSYRCKAVVERARAAGRRQRPGRLVAQARRATARNVNELTHQRLTDIGRAPSFYDCLVEVEAGRRPGRGVRRGARVRWRGRSAASPRPRCCAGAGVCLTSGCSTVGYYAQSVDRPPRADAGGATGAAVARRSGDDRRALKERLALSQRIRDFAVSRARASPTTPATAATPT